MPTIEEIVKDSEHFPDNLQWQLADGIVVTLGDMRAKIRAYDQGFTQKTQEVARQRQELAAKQKELADAYSIFQQQVQQFQAQQAAAPPAPTNQPTVGDIFSEPGEYFKPLIERLRGYDDRYKQYDDRLNQIFELARDSISWVADREIDKDYKAAQEAFKDYWEDGDTLSREALTKYAHENKLVDKRGFPLVRDAAEKFLSPKMRERELADAEKRGYEKAAKEHPSAPNYPRPGFAGQGAQPSKSYGGDLNSLFRDMRQDSDVNGALGQLFGWNG